MPRHSMYAYIGVVLGVNVYIGIYGSPISRVWDDEP